MGNCERELADGDWWQAFDDRWGGIFEAMNEMKALRALRAELTIELPKCGSAFYIQCDFDRLIRICPFDPAWDAFEWKHQVTSERLQALEVQVKELQAKLPTSK